MYTVRKTRDVARKVAAATTALSVRSREELVFPPFSNQRNVEAVISPTQKRIYDPVSTHLFIQ